MSPRRTDPPVCIALDTADLAGARALLDALGGMAPIFKVGLELFCAEGPRAVEEVRDRGAEVFLDLKVNDIPKQAAGAVAAAARIGVRYLTVHGNGGRAMVRAAVEAAGDNGPDILVVSVVTSLDAEDLRELGVTRSMSEQVDAMAALATEQGAPGLVLAAAELRQIRNRYPDLYLVTPGIRPEASAPEDQRRTGTPREAITAGADLLVLGRAVSQAADPASVLRTILADIEQTRAGAVR